MPWTKLDIIKQAYSEIGKSSFDFEISPEEMQSALRQLDAMMASWGGAYGIRVGYAGGNGFGDLSADVLVPDWATEALYLNLAIRLAPSFGKTVSPHTLATASKSLAGVQARTVKPGRVILRGYGGAGLGGRNVIEPERGPQLGADSFLTFGAA